MIKVCVRHTTGDYPVLIGNGVLERLERHLERECIQGRTWVFYDAQVYALHGARIRKCLGRIRRRATEMVLPVGERYKSAATLSKIYDFLLGQKVERSDFILAVGGGVVSDLVGYAAATTLRGLRWGVVSTTLLGMVDAAIGGKTGINHRSGKNLIGAFWQPRFVFCDTYLLNTLSWRQFLSGMGEVVKYGGLIGGPLPERLESVYGVDAEVDESVLTQLISSGVSYKADIVAKDEREQGPRMLLNLGHTFAHGIEAALGYGRLLHGEAVLLGLRCAVDLSCLVKPGACEGLRHYRDVVDEYIKRIPRRRIDVPNVLESMRVDKKRAGGRQKYVLLERPGKPFIADNIRGRFVRRSLEGMCGQYNARDCSDA